MKEIKKIGDRARVLMHLTIGLLIACIIYRLNIFNLNVRAIIVVNMAFVLLTTIYILLIKKAYQISMRHSLLNLRSRLKFMAIAENYHALLILFTIAYSLVVDNNHTHVLSYFLLSIVAVYLFMGNVSLFVMRKVNVVAIVRDDNNVITNVLMFPMCNLTYVDYGRTARLTPDTVVLEYLEFDLTIVEVIVASDVYNEDKYVQHYSYDRNDYKVEYSEYQKKMQDITNEMVDNVEKGMSKNKADDIAVERIKELEDILHK